MYHQGEGLGVGKEFLPFHRHCDVRSGDSGKSDVGFCSCGVNPGEGKSRSGSHGVGAGRHRVPMFTLE